MDSDLLILACVSILGTAAVISVYLITSAQARIAEAKTERSAIYAGKARMESEAELAALSMNQPQGETDVLTFLLQIAQSNPELAQKAIQALTNAGGQNPPPPGG